MDSGLVTSPGHAKYVLCFDPAFEHLTDLLLSDQNSELEEVPDANSTVKASDRDSQGDREVHQGMHL